MTTLAELISDVYTITNRPDLVAETTLAVKKATLKEHTAIDYPRDLVTSSVIALDNTAGTFRYPLSLVTLGLSTSLRKFKFIKEVLGTVGSALYTTDSYYGALDFKERAPNDLFDNYYQEFWDYYYRQGNTIQLVASRQVDNIAIQYYAKPDIGDATYSSWIADMYPYAIYDAAAAIVFKVIGKDAEYARLKQDTQDNRLDIIRSEITAIG